jgi:hypothetical protein
MLVRVALGPKKPFGETAQVRTLGHRR